MRHSASFNCLEHMLKLLHEPLKAFISSVIGHFKGANQRFNCLTGHSTRPVAHCPFQGKKELPIWTNSEHINRTAQPSRGLSAPMVFALKGSMFMFFFLQNLHLIMPVCCSDINNDASISCYTGPLMTKMGKHKSVTVNNSQIP